MGVFLQSLEEIAPGARITIYGAGNAGYRLRRRLRADRPDVDVRRYLDSRRSGAFDGLEMLALDGLEPPDPPRDLILVASVHWPEMVEALEARGVTAFKVYDESIHLPADFGGIIQEERVRQLCLAAHYAHTLPGDLAEFGVATGASAAILAGIMKAEDGLGRPPRRLFLFDSFEGLPEATSDVDRDTPLVRSGAWGPGAFRVRSVERVLERITACGLTRERLVVTPGFFEASLARIPAGTRFSLAHVDCDLYLSALQVLEACFGRGLLVPGAMLLFDEWQATGADPELGERRAWAEAVERFNVRFSDVGEYSWHGRKFVVHGYDAAR